MKVFYLPDLGEGLSEAEIREWYVKVGDEVVIDQPLVSMETAKAVVDVPSPYQGKIIALHGHSNDIIATGAPLISFELAENATSKSESVVGSLEANHKNWDEDNVIIHPAQQQSSTFKIMPAARVLATQMNIDLSSIKPTGPEGLIVVEDVKKLIAYSQTISTQEGMEKLHGVRREMANQMTRSHREVVPVTLVEDADITTIKNNVDITTFLIRALIFASKAEPSLNAWFDGKLMQRKLFNEVNIGIAIDTQEGLFVPVIKNAEHYGDMELREKLNTYKKSVSDRTIKQDDMKEATIILSNFGTFSGRYATPIVVRPMVAILAVGRIREIPLVKNNRIEIGRIMPLSLTFDHRAVTGGEASRFLSCIVQFLST